MKRIELFQIDTFTDKVFHGNPAMVCLMDEWLNDELLQAIAIENRLSETVFVVESKEGMHLRWFTPKGELPLCGHGTLAAAFLLFELGKWSMDRITFLTQLGVQTVFKKEHERRLIMTCPLIEYHPIAQPIFLSSVIQWPVLEYFESEHEYVLLLHHERDILSAQIDLKLLFKLPKRGLILTAKSFDADFHSRCFYPKYGIIDDVVTPFAYGLLAPLWSKRLNEATLIAEQGGMRRGELFCQIKEQHVQVSGFCKWYSKGYLMI